MLQVRPRLFQPGEERVQVSKPAQLPATTPDVQKRGCNSFPSIFPCYFFLVRVRPDAGPGIASQLAKTASGMLGVDLDEFLDIRCCFEVDYGLVLVRIRKDTVGERYRGI
jgi:hypothetical protein